MTAQDEFESRDMELPVAPISIRGIKRDAKGPQWTLSEGPPHAFVWVEMIAHLRSEDMALVVGPWLSVSIHAQGTAVHSPDAEDGDQQIRVLRFLPTNPTGSSVQDSMKTTAMVALLSEEILLQAMRRWP